MKKDNSETNKITLEDSGNREKFKKSLKTIKIFLIVVLILAIVLFSLSIWYSVELVSISTSPDDTIVPNTTFVLSTIISILSIISFIVSLVASITILVNGTKYKETKEIALIFGILGIFLGWLFSLIYYFVAKNKIKNIENKIKKDEKQLMKLFQQLNNNFYRNIWINFIS